MVRELTAALRSKTGPLASDRTLIRYQLGIPELWARTYVQWVVAKSDDLLLEACLRNVLREPDTVAGRTVRFYWEAEEWNGMIPLVDGLFSEAGLL